MIYLVCVEAIDQDVEEEITLVVCGQKLICFASFVPYRLEVGKSYQAELLPMVFNEYLVQEMPHEESSIERDGLGYAYNAIGELRNGCLTCGKLIFCDEVLLSDYGYLDEKMVSWRIDRLDVAFI